MMVLAGREGRWKYEDGVEEDDEEGKEPRRLEPGAERCGLAEKFLFDCEEGVAGEDRLEVRSRVLESADCLWRPRL